MTVKRWTLKNGREHCDYVKAANYDALLSLNAELLEALEKAIPALELYHAYGWPDFEEVIAKARAAIAKARSQS